MNVKVFYLLILLFALNQNVYGQKQCKEQHSVTSKPKDNLIALLDSSCFAYGVGSANGRPETD